jgi:hypothetical protein
MDFDLKKHHKFVNSVVDLQQEFISFFLYIFLLESKSNGLCIMLLWVGIIFS